MLNSRTLVIQIRNHALIRSRSFHKNFLIANLSILQRLALADLSSVVNEASSQCHVVTNDNVVEDDAVFNLDGGAKRDISANDRVVDLAGGVFKVD